MSQHIIVCGSPISGLSFIGPFPSFADAAQYAEANLSDGWELAELNKGGQDTTPRVLVEVKGGIAEFSGSTHDVDVEIFDWDNWNASTQKEREDMRLPKVWGELNPALPLSDN